MTISEFIQAHIIRQLLCGNGPYTPAPPLRCGDGLVLSVQVPLGGHISGPWRWFQTAVLEVGPGPIVTAPETMQAAQLLVLLEEHGWPEEQLGKHWKKHRSKETHD